MEKIRTIEWGHDHVCPKCGNSDSNKEGTVYPFLRRDVTEKEYTCPKCGCQWRVKPNQKERKEKEKFADRPQILEGDIVRVVGEATKEESCHVVSAVRDTGVYSDHPNYHYNEEIVAIYRFDGLDFKCIWESGEGWLNRFKNSLLGLRKSTKEFDDSMKELIAAIKKSKEKAGDGKHGSEKAD